MRGTRLPRPRINPREGSQRRAASKYHPTMPAQDRVLRPLSIAYLLVQSASLAVYWLVLWISPPARAPFLAPGAPDSTVLAFAAGDLTVYAGASLAAAYALWRRRRWAWPALLVHAGAATYAATYALLLAIYEPTRALGALMMLPALLVPPAIAWLHKPAYRGSA